MFEDEDQKILKQLRKKKTSFKQLISKRDLDDLEMDKAFKSF
jgi:hypothetical protein